jgi:hypothetical protein
MYAAPQKMPINSHFGLGEHQSKALFPMAVVSHSQRGAGSLWLRFAAKLSRSPNTKAAFGTVRCSYGNQATRRVAAIGKDAMPKKPKIIAQVDGSGTAEMLEISNEFESE